MSINDQFRSLVSMFAMHQSETDLDFVTDGKRLAALLAVTPAMLVGFFAVAWTVRAADLPIAVCLVKQFFGVPCPGCGITRSIAALLAGNPSKAIELNAAGPFVVAFFLIQLALVAAAAMGAAPDRAVLRWARLSDQMLFVLMLSVWLKRILW